MCVMQSADKSLGQIDDSIAHIQHPHGYLIMCFHLEDVFFKSFICTFRKRLCCKECIRNFFNKRLSDVCTQLKQCFQENDV